MKIRCPIGLIFFASWSSACSLAGLGHGVMFRAGSATLQAQEIRSVTDWYVDLRDGEGGIDFVFIYAYSVKGEEA